MIKTTLNEFINSFSNTICDLTENKVYSTVIFLCLGTDRITGDTFGPIVGHKLKKLFKNTKNIVVMGDLEKTVCNCNIDEWIKLICKNYSNPFIICVDSALSYNCEDIGKIIVSKGGLFLGSCLGRKSCFIGDIGIKGIVAKNFGNPRSNMRILQNVRTWES